MTFQIEFPDFPEADMPAIPAGFDDISWGSEACPSFANTALQLIIFVDYADAALSEFPEERESGEMKRFMLARREMEDDGAYTADSENEWLAESDRWEDVAAAIEYLAGVATQFPAFPMLTLPLLPRNFKTTLLTTNSPCPSFEHTGLGLLVWTDWPEAQDRRLSGVEGKRFMLERTAATCGHKDAREELLVSDDWSEIMGVVLGEAFVAEVEDQYEEAEIAEIRVRNRAHKDSDACATHDFADANMIMLEAFQALFLRDPAFLKEGTDDKGKYSPAAKADVALWNLGWSHAKEVHLTAQDDEDTPLEAMTKEFEAYVATQKLPKEADANELLMFAELTPQQREWLDDLCVRWDAAQAAEDKGAN